MEVPRETTFSGLHASPPKVSDAFTLPFLKGSRGPEVLTRPPASPGPSPILPACTCPLPSSSFFTLLHIQRPVIYALPAQNPIQDRSVLPPPLHRCVRHAASHPVKPDPGACAWFAQWQRKKACEREGERQGGGGEERGREVRGEERGRAVRGGRERQGGGAPMVVMLPRPSALR